MPYPPRPGLEELDVMGIQRIGDGAMHEPCEVGVRDDEALQAFRLMGIDAFAQQPSLCGRLVRENVAPVTLALEAPVERVL